MKRNIIYILFILFFNFTISQEYVDTIGGRGSLLIMLRDSFVPIWTLFRFTPNYPVLDFYPNAIILGSSNKNIFKRRLFFNNIKNVRPVGYESLFHRFRNTELHSKYGQSFQELVTIDLPEKKDHVFVVSGFSLVFDNENTKIKKLGVYEENGKLNILFGSTEPQSSFQWLVDYIYFPTNRLLKLGREAGNTSTGIENEIFLEEMMQSKDVIYVIRGFKMEHELSSYLTSIWVYLKDSGVVSVSSDCQEKPGHFKWMVDWAVIKKH